MKIKTFQIKKDQYRTARGKYSRFLDIYCSHCGDYILLYQKDGPGVLKRLYLDRIFAPEKLSSLQNVTDMKEVPQLSCLNCRRLIAIPGLYDKEQRGSYLLLSHAVISKRGRGFYPPKEKRIKYV